jgi:hypothetical protein
LRFFHTIKITTSKTIAKIIAVVDSENHNLSIAVKTVDKELSALNANTLKEQYTEFCELVAERGKEFGIAVF